MRDFYWQALRLTGVVALIALVSNAIVGPLATLWGLVLFVSALLLWYAYWTARLGLWLKNPELSSVPVGAGLWEAVFYALFRETRRHVRTHAQLGALLERYQRAAGALPDAVVLLDNSDKIEWCNSPAERQLGLSVPRDRGQRIGYLIRQSEFLDYLQGSDYREPLKLESLRNPETTLEVRLVPFGDSQKLLLCHDITPLEKLDTMRRDFIANVSHELRTPLTVVGGFLETLGEMQKGIPRNLRHYLALMQEQTGRMRRLVEDLLVLSQLESGQHVLQETPLDVAGLLGTIASEARELSGGRHVIELEADARLKLYGSMEEIHSAFGNLVSNAIRYTPEGGHIRIRWEKQDGEAVFSVADDGIGIESHHLGRLTERFYRVDRSRSRETGGTGLGLSIVKHILTRHQGRLQIESQPDAGSTFSAIFPVVRVR